MTNYQRLNCMLHLVGSFSVAISLAAVPAFAGKITGFTTFGAEDGTGPGLGSVQVSGIVHLNDNNDNQSGGGPNDNNITVPVKRFDHNGYIDIEFHVDNTGGVSEYQVVEFVDNNVLPASSWTQFEIYLGFGVGANFVISPANDDLDFDAPTFDSLPSSLAFSQVSTGEDKLVFYNGAHGTGAKQYTFRIDVPDLSQGTFTLRQVPVVPEPSTFALTALAGFAGLIGWRRRAA